MEESFSNFQKDSQNLSKFNNKNIVEYYCSKNEEKTFYILMEYCDGLNLEKFLEENKIPNKENKENKVTLIKEDVLNNINKQICLKIKEIH